MAFAVQAMLSDLAERQADLDERLQPRLDRALELAQSASLGVGYDFLEDPTASRPMTSALIAASFWSKPRCPLTRRAPGPLEVQVLGPLVRGRRG